MVTESYSSQGAPYLVDVYRGPVDGKKHPAVLLVHGNAGLISPYGDQIRGFAKDLSKLGYVTAVPKYYRDDVPHPTDTTPHVQTLADAVEHVAKNPGVDPDRIGLIGYSLGATTCMTLISSKPQGAIKAFADFFGFLTSSIEREAVRFPPTIIFHNQDDRIVVVKNSEELDQLLTSASVPHEFVTPYTEDWQEIDHSFEPGGHADTDSRERATDWFVKHLPPIGV